MHYPAAIVKTEDSNIDFKVFRNEKHRQRFIEKLIGNATPEFKPPMTRNDLQSFIEKQNIELVFNVVDIPKNGGRNHWPFDIICPKCSSLEIYQHGALQWNGSDQNWQTKAVLGEGYCPQCSLKIIPKEAFIPITLEP